MNGFNFFCVIHVYVQLYATILMLRDLLLLAPIYKKKPGFGPKFQSKRSMSTSPDSLFWLQTNHFYHFKYRSSSKERLVLIFHYVTWPGCDSNSLS